MQFLIGLGNPGEKYAQTRHNVGWLVLDELVKSWGVREWQKADKLHSLVVRHEQRFLVKPQTYMNDSGQAVRAVLDYYQKPEWVPELDLPNLYVIHDDLDIELGSYKLQFGKGPKVHNGLLSIYQHLKTHQFWHVRVGVDGRAGDRRMPGQDYVLKNFLPTELPILQTAVQEIVRELQALREAA